MSTTMSVQRDSCRHCKRILALKRFAALSSTLVAIPNAATKSYLNFSSCQFKGKLFHVDSYAVCYLWTLMVLLLRVPRYKLLLKQLLKKTDQAHPDYKVSFRPSFIQEKYRMAHISLNDYSCWKRHSERWKRWLSKSTSVWELQRTKR
jgi:hypothetical protein